MALFRNEHGYYKEWVVLVIISIGLLACVLMIASLAAL